MRDQNHKIRAPLIPPNTIECCDGLRGFRGALKWARMMSRDASLSDNYPSVLPARSRYKFFSETITTNIEENDRNLGED